MQDGSRLSASHLRELGVLRESDGMPAFMPEGDKAFLGPDFLAGARWFPDYYADNYTMEWSGNGYGFLEGQPRDMQTRIGTKKLNFAVRFDNSDGGYDENTPCLLYTSPSPRDS